MDRTHKHGRQARFGILEAAIALGFAILLAIGGVVGYRYFRPGSKSPAPASRIVPVANLPGHWPDNARLSPDGNRIAFMWDGGSCCNEDIYVKQVGVEKPLRLTTDPAIDDSPTWSPDGRYIAFRRHGEQRDAIYVVPAVGGPERKLYTLDEQHFTGDLDWSPDGKSLAIIESAPLAYEGIFLLSVDNPKDKRRLTTSIAPIGQGSDYYPRFSPDGQTVAFIRATDIFLMRLGGGEPKRLTSDDSAPYGLDWTPDGACIVFISDRQGGTRRLWKTSASGGQPEQLSLPPGVGEGFSVARHARRLAFTQLEMNVNIWRYEVPQTAGQIVPPTKLIASTGSNLWPQYSPDGKKVAFLSSRSGSPELWVSDSDGSNPRRLTFFNDPDPRNPPLSTPRWSPDGREIFFIPPAGHREAIDVVSADGGPLHSVKTDETDVEYPSWSRDGKWIYFGSKRSGTWQVWKMHADGTHPVQITKKGGFAARESHDGKTLYYAKRIQFPGWRKYKGLWRVPAGGGQETLVLKELEAGMEVFWDLTSEGVYFYNDNRNTIDFFDFATHRITQIAKPEKPGWPFAVSPDGRWILYPQTDVDTSHIMLVEDFRW